jgi:hypothetical protein
MSNSLTVQQAIATMPTDDLQKAVNLAAERKRIIREFVQSQLEAGKDFGTIEVKTRNGGSAQTKPVLFKSGMEKIFSLFEIRSELAKDVDTLEMVGKTGVIAYLCKLYRGEQLVGEGRGACEVAEKGRVNDAIKIAEKRARMDACLNLGFSEYFTQDLDDRGQEDDLRGTAEKADGSASSLLPPDWKAGEVHDVELTVEKGEMKTSQSGTTYALMQTNYGPVKAWKNTYSRFKAGRKHQVCVSVDEWKGSLSLSIVAYYADLGTLGGTEDSQAVTEGELQE